ncbi:unnamed protein product, partial [Mesorhabditis belari]|uniref:Dynactin subunit 4 n=1 Tax=Mesorhabditis belari TaxID=2138241 RepID=A0AAF3FCE0_9BILA
MASLYQSDRNKYECSCGAWDSLGLLYFCRHCSVTRCSSCVLVELDCFLCQNCLESAPVTEARLKKNRCFACNFCPFCATVLTKKTCVNSGNTFLSCGVCRWSTRDAGIPDQSKTTTDWPMPENPLSKRLNEISGHFKDLETREKARKEKDTTKRRTNFGGFDASKFSDRFGVQKMIQARKKAIETPASTVESHVATADVPALPDDVFESTAAIQLPLNVINKQPLVEETTLLPVRLPLKGRKAIRCRKCEHHLLKLDYSPNAINYKISAFARNTIPEIRLSRGVELVVGQQSSILLTLLNHSENGMQIILTPDADDSAFEIVTESIDITLSPLDAADVLLGAEESKYSAASSSSSSNIVFQRRNRVGIRLDLCPKVDFKCLPLSLKFKNIHTTAKLETSADWKMVKVRVGLDK